MEVFIPPQMYRTIALRTNQHAVAQTGKSLLLKNDECEQFFGASLLMSVLKFPWIRMYWSQPTRIAAVADAFTRDRFHFIRGHLKVVNDVDVTDEQKKGRLWKVRPLVESVRSGCLQQERPPQVSIDEQMIPFTGKTTLKQYVPGKPHPEGLKNFVLASPRGLVLDFEVYQGKKLDDGGAEGTSRLLEQLEARGLHGTGTIKKNLVPKEAKLPTERELAKRGRGTSVCAVRSDDAVAFTAWQDRKMILLGSTEHGIEPSDTCKRYQKTSRSYIDVTRPAVVKAYNANMGGVDLNDRMIAHYRSGARTRKWTVKTILHFFDLSAVNAWLLYQQDAEEAGIKGAEMMKFLQFKYALAMQLLKGISSDGSSHSSSGSSDVEEPDGPDPKKRRRATVPMPSPARLRSGKHLPKCHPRKEFQRCRKPGCHQQTGMECRRCKIFLCCRPDRDCFHQFHEGGSNV
ncbi:piggyBac transposable element-derived protein 3-like [Amphibalanus amphitrite]|uniref:piggyBac transposable element-derived protein 3-like n=1 Tax=Amphibalanus amphitrite TaxID=1232801 RepID=UPI001C916F53|nr:piggyBac transposable element-derived protein 3-like [Amphibalanus amphitrite]